MGAPSLRVFCAKVGFHGSVQFGLLHLILLLPLLLLLGGAAVYRCDNRALVIAASAAEGRQRSIVDIIDHITQSENRFAR